MIEKTEKSLSHGGPGCQILQLPAEGRWKWRHTAADGIVTDSPETYEYHYQCAASARRSGYSPDSKWFVAN